MDSKMANDNDVAVIVLAAGKGTRMKSATPKVLHKLCGRPILYRVLQSAGEVSSDVVVVLRHEFDALKTAALDFGKALNLRLKIARQSEIPGTGSAVIAAFEHLANENVKTVVVVSADTPLITAQTLNSLVKAHSEAKNAATILTAQIPNSTGYGRIVRAENGAVLGIVEEKDADDAQKLIREINSSIYAFDRAFLEQFLHKLGTANAQAEKYLTQIIELGAENGAQIGALAVEEFGADVIETEGVNDRAQLSRLDNIRRLQIIEEHQLNGVTIVDPTNTRIEEDVEIDQDVEILPGSIILSDNKIASGAVIGPYAYLRPGNVVGKNAKIGAFVEVKNSQVGNDSKIPHLSYVGDAIIGERTNIGAGSIFANYDGKHKHKTIVGSGVKIGSKTVLVAPVEVADNAYTGAGTVLRKNVPENALAYSENGITITDEWVKNNRNSAK